MTKEKEAFSLLQAMNDIDDDYIAEALHYKKKKAVKKREKIHWSAGLTAAFAVLLIGLVIYHQPLINNDQSAVQQVNPYQEVADLQEAESITGFSMYIPEAQQPYDNVSYTVIDGEIIEVTYSDEAGNTGYSIRKGKGTEDISGDYTDYADTKEMTTDNVVITLNGTDEKWQLVTWDKDGYAYAIDIQNEIFTEDQIIQIVQTLNAS